MNRFTASMKTPSETVPTITTQTPVPLSIASNNDPYYEHQLPFSNSQLLDYYEQSLITAFQQVDELKRITRSRKLLRSDASKTWSSSTRKSSNVFKKSGGGSGHPHRHGRRSSKTTSIEMGDEKEGPSTADGLMLAVDKFLTAEFRG